MSQRHFYGRYGLASVIALGICPSYGRPHFRGKRRHGRKAVPQLTLQPALINPCKTAYCSYVHLCSHYRFVSSSNHLTFIEFVRFEVFTTVTMKNVVFWILRRVALIRTDVLEELRASIIRVTRIGQLRT
jgi:hypothetical protein